MLKINHNKLPAIFIYHSNYLKNEDSINPSFCMNAFLLFFTFSWSFPQICLAPKFMSNTHSKKIKTSGFYCCSVGHMSIVHSEDTSRNPPSDENGCNVFPFALLRGGVPSQLGENSSSPLSPFLYCEPISPHSKHRSVQSAVF